MAHIKINFSKDKTKEGVYDESAVQRKMREKQRKIKKCSAPEAIRVIHSQAAVDGLLLSLVSGGSPKQVGEPGPHGRGLGLLDERRGGDVF